MFDNVFGHMDDGHVVCLTLLDLSATFLHRWHRILLRRLRETIKIDGTALRWFESYLDMHSVRVCVDGQYSQEATGDWIKRIHNCLTDEAAKAIVHALIISKIGYRNSLLINLINQLCNWQTATPDERRC